MKQEIKFIKTELIIPEGTKYYYGRLLRNPLFIKEEICSNGWKKWYCYSPTLNEWILDTEGETTPSEYQLMPYY